MLTAENPYSFKTTHENTPSDRILSELIYKAALLDPRETEKILSGLVSQTCYQKNNCLKNKNGCCQGLNCSNFK